MAVAVIMMIRLDKYLADMGAGTRSEIKKSIRAGRAAVNGAVTKRPETRIDTAKDTVELNGQNVSYEAYEYFMLNKPHRLRRDRPAGDDRGKPDPGPETG